MITSLTKIGIDMPEDKKSVEEFFSHFDKHVYELAMKLREIILDSLPGVAEVIDIPAKMVAYSYGQKYTELICIIIPSKKGVKLGFNRGTELPDPNGLLQGTGKISRFVVIKSEEQARSTELKKLLQDALSVYVLNKTEKLN
jgi:hypothetical protein